MEGAGSSDERDIAALYAASYRRLVGLVGAITQDRGVAEEAVQDAFARLLVQWATVREYEDPEGWVRKVALGFASKRHRKHLNGLRALHRYGLGLQISPAPSADGVDVRRALAALPLPQRSVIVLQNLGLGVEDIARELDVPVGTVKSRLSRARAALVPLLREDVTRHG